MQNITQKTSDLLCGLKALIAILSHVRRDMGLTPWLSAIGSAVCFVADQVDNVVVGLSARNRTGPHP